MKRFMVGLLTLASVCVVSPARAALTVHDDVRLDYVTTAKDNGAGTEIVFPSNGGPFWVTIYEDDRPTGAGGQDNGTWVGSDSTLIDAFYTFAAQRAEKISAGARYDIQQMQVRTLGSAKVLTGYGAWVFDKFNAGVAAGLIDPRLNTAANVNLLGVYQAAIWMGIVGWADANHDGAFQLSESLDAVGGATAEFVANRESYALGSGSNLRSLASEGLRYSDFLADTWWAPGSQTELAMLRIWNGIQLMNLQTAAGADAQDQMIAYGGSLSVAVVPEPASAMIWFAVAVATVVATGRQCWRNRHAKAVSCQQPIA